MRKLAGKPEVIFAVLGTIFIGISIFLFPLNRIPDETNHARMAWGILYGKTDNSFDWMNSIKDIDDVDRAEYEDLFTQKIDFSKEKVENNFSVKKIVHLPQLAGMLLGKKIYPSVGVMMTLGRIFNALVFLVAMFFIIKHAKFGKLPLVFISLLPISVQQAASLSYDVGNFIFVAFVFCLISNWIIDRKLNLKTFLEIALIFIGCYLTKRNNYFLILLLPFLCFNFSDKYPTLNRILNKIYAVISRFRIVLFLLGLILSFVLAVFIFKNNVGITRFIQVMINSVLNNHLNNHINGILSLGMFGYLGQFQVQMPLWLIYIDIIVLALLMLQKKEDLEINRTFGVASGLMFPLQVFVIIGGMYFSWTPRVLGANADISVGSQGRYFTPFLIFFAPFFLSIKDKVYVEMKDYFATRLTQIMCIINFLVMVYLVTFYYWLPDYEANWLIHLREMLN